MSLFTDGAAKIQQALNCFPIYKYVKKIHCFYRRHLEAVVTVADCEFEVINDTSDQEVQLDEKVSFLSQEMWKLYYSCILTEV
jgi:hypothetical protein